MTTEELSTRDKILKTAHRLFAEKGFNAVGVRELAKEADVNVAAINYHFGNKETLYTETIKTSMRKTSHDIEKIYASCSDDIRIEELVEKIFDYFVVNREDLLTGFKLFLTSSRQNEDIYDDENEIGPPGGHIIYSCLLKNIPDANDEDLIWAVRTIFTQIIHKAMLICTHNEVMQKRFGIGPNQVKQDVLRLVKVVVAEIN